jgi:hypothetical protein
MHKLIVLTIIASLAFGFATFVNGAPTAKAPQNVIVVSYRYIGNSTALVVPNIGINGMHATCQADFGDGARMCTTTEVFETPNMPQTSPSFAWVQPVITDIIVDGTNVHYGVAGRIISHAISEGIRGVNCSAWTDTTVARGTTVTNSLSGVMSIGSDSCDEDFRVACCLAQ